LVSHGTGHYNGGGFPGAREHLRFTRPKPLRQLPGAQEMEDARAADRLGRDEVHDRAVR